MRYSGSRVIIVDDDQGTRDLLQDNLEKVGYICYTAGRAKATAGIGCADADPLELKRISAHPIVLKGELRLI